MFLRGLLDLAPVALLATPQLETPFLYLLRYNTTATSSPAGCSGKGQPRDTVGGGSKVVYGNQDHGRKNRPIFFVKEKPSPERTRFNVRHKPGQREERRFIGSPRRALCQPRLGREKPANFFRRRKTLPSTHRISHASQN